ncbi:hypothetical protein HDV05_006923, partial [Chytridiales sp. JEL 0842]
MIRSHVLGLAFRNMREELSLALAGGATSIAIFSIIVTIAFSLARHIDPFYITLFTKYLAILITRAYFVGMVVGHRNTHRISLKFWSVFGPLGLFGFWGLIHFLTVQWNQDGYALVQRRWVLVVVYLSDFIFLTLYEFCMENDDRHPLKMYACCDDPRYLNGHPVVLSEEDARELREAKRAAAIGELPAGISLSFLMKCFLGSAMSVLSSNTLSYLPQFLITGAFTKAIKKVIVRNAATTTFDIQETIVLPYLIFIYELYSSDISYHLLYHSQSSTVYAIGLVSSNLSDLLQILYAHREDVMIALNDKSNYLRRFLNPRAKVPHRNSNSKVEPLAMDDADSKKESDGDVWKKSSTIIKATSTTKEDISISHTSTKEVNTDISPSISESETVAREERTIKFSSGTTTGKSTNPKNGEAVTSIFESGFQKPGTLTRETARALTIHAAKTFNAMQSAQAKLAPFMWLGRFSALMVSSFRFAIYGSANVVNSLRASQPVTASLIFNPLSAVMDDPDIVAF